MRVVRERYHALEGPMLIRPKISGPETLLNLLVSIDEDLTALHRNCR